MLQTSSPFIPQWEMNKYLYLQPYEIKLSTKIKCCVVIGHKKYEVLPFPHHPWDLSIQPCQSSPIHFFFQCQFPQHTVLPTPCEKQGLY